jgi:hypothetical protein
VAEETVKEIKQLGPTAAGRSAARLSACKVEPVLLDQMQREPTLLRRARGQIAIPNCALASAPLAIQRRSLSAAFQAQADQQGRLTQREILG